MSQEVAAIVLAAGMSQRMGRPKLLLPFGDRPILARVVETLSACSGISQIFVVTGHYEEEIQSVLRDYSSVHMVHNSDYAAGGMFSSVKTGVSALAANTSAFFLVLGDQPAIRPETLTTLLETWWATQAPIVLPIFLTPSLQRGEINGSLPFRGGLGRGQSPPELGAGGRKRRGHPVLFSAALAPEILALPTDATLKDIIHRYTAELREAPVSDPAVCWDIDTPEDYERALREWESREI